MINFVPNLAVPSIGGMEAPDRATHKILRSVSTQHRIGFPSCIIRTDRAPNCWNRAYRTAGPKKLKLLQFFIIRVAGHRFKLKQKIGSKSPRAAG